MPEIKKRECPKCGHTKFQQRYHAIMKDVGYIDDESGEFEAETTDCVEVTNGIEVFACWECGHDMPIPEEDDEDESSGDEE